MKMSRKRVAGLALFAALAFFAAPLNRIAETVDAPAVQTAMSAGGRVLIPGGLAVGVALKTQGVMVVANAAKGDARSALRVGDVIVSVQGSPVGNTAALSACIAAAKADSVTLGVLRNGRQMTIEAKAPVDDADGRRRLGVWVRDSTAGVGTLSYIDPVTMNYGALGHAIVDADTGDMVSVREGAILRAQIVGVTRGESGSAGELKGSFLKEGIQIGTLSRNLASGVYGHMDAPPDGLLYPQGLPMASRREVRAGPASIISTVGADGPQEYSVEILRCYAQDAPGRKDMLLLVTDERLLKTTGGIVQGMSGSPIIQDGKLVGAVTHVLVNDPTRGYGIFIENMLDAAG